MNIFLGGQTDRQHIQALAMCRQVPYLEVLFQKLLDETRTALVFADDTDAMRRLQHRARVLSDFLEAVNDAPSVLERLSGRSQKHTVSWERHTAGAPGTKSVL